MDSINIKWNSKIVKIIEMLLLGSIAYYGAKYGAQSNYFIFLAIYGLLFAIMMIDYFKSNPQREKINMYIKYFYEQNRFNPNDDVRVTIHKKLNDNQYEQYCDYYPRGTKLGKKYPIKKGLVRHAFTQANGEFSENFTSEEEKLDKLVNIYNFRQDEAKRQVQDGEMSYYCKPIVRDGETWGVLYMNSKKVYTFPLQASLAGSNISQNAEIFVKMIENEIS